MLYDLCLGQGSADSLAVRDLLARAAVLGWDSVAVQHRAGKPGQQPRRATGWRRSAPAAAGELLETFCCCAQSASRTRPPCGPAGRRTRPRGRTAQQTAPAEPCGRPAAARARPAAAAGAPHLSGQHRGGDCGPVLAQQRCPARVRRPGGAAHHGPCLRAGAALPRPTRAGRAQPAAADGSARERRPVRTCPLTSSPWTCPGACPSRCGARLCRPLSSGASSSSCATPACWRLARAPPS